jgi:hypothetical protein
LTVEGLGFYGVRVRGVKALACWDLGFRMYSVAFTIKRMILGFRA